MPTVFFEGREVWQQVRSALRQAKHIRAAIAYFGQGASHLVPLKRNDILVVDMSLKAVGQGVTDPREIAKLLRRGVRVFSRSNLHAKFLILYDVLFVGSANASHMSVSVLDEAALMTSDHTARQLAAQCLEKWCTEPVRPRYLKQCLSAYRPPRFKAATELTKKRTSSASEAVKLWLIGGLHYAEVPEREIDSAKAAIQQAAVLRHQPERTEINQLYFPSKFQLMSRIKPGDWAITCIRDGRGYDVWPPQQLLSIESYARGQRTRRWVMQFEAPKDRQSMRLRIFQRAIKRSVVDFVWNGSRTRSVRQAFVADAVLRLWTQAGRLSAKVKQAG